MVVEGALDSDVCRLEPTVSGGPGRHLSDFLRELQMRCINEHIWPSLSLQESQRHMVLTWYGEGRREWEWEDEGEGEGEGGTGGLVFKILSG